MYLEYRDVSGNMVHLPLDESGEPVTIGRNPGSTIYAKESTVSRNHGRIGYDGETWYLKDLGSSNGSFHNSERTTRSQLTAGDLVRIGEVFEIKLLQGEPDAELTPNRGQRSRGKKPTTMGRADGGRPKPGASSADERRRRNKEREAERERRRKEREERRSGRSPAAEPAPEKAKERLERKPAPAKSEERRRARRESEARPRTPRRTQSTGESRVVSAMPDPNASGDVAELKRKVAALEAALADSERRATQIENDSKSAEARAMRYSVELDGLGDKYIKLKEQNRVMGASLEETREDQRKREDSAFEAERRVSDLEQELESARTKAADATEQLSGLKVRLTQKDRQIEELQRQLDLLEYELRSHRDEIEMLQADYNRGGGETDRLERKVNLLQEVIQEKESVIEQLRIDLRDKDIEIRQARMGVGISDLEHEKRTLLEDYHNAMRRSDEMSDRIEKQRRETDALRRELEDSKKVVEERKAGPTDITDHPDFKAKVRELERAEEQLSQAQRDIAKAELKLESLAADSESTKKLAGEVSMLQKKNDTLQSRLESAESRVAELQEIEDKAPSGPTIPIGVDEDIEALQDAAAASKSNARLVRKYAQTLEKSLDKESDLGEAADLLYDIAVVLVQDITEQVRMVKELEHKLISEEA
ncbi:MAG: FHA domain-containing protein [Myxococcales bacterium]|nr:FHA domain-containing protein [Myxococcales bacterium]